MRRILFVDDEQGILDGLRRMLRPHRKDWDMEFAPGAEAALEMMAAAPFDVIVSDMRMPGTDGAALLEVVRKKYPGMLRIILSGYTDLQASLRAVPVAHQFLLKPCNPDSLRAGILRSTALSAMLDSRMLASLVGSLRDMPAMRSSYGELRALLERGDASVEAIHAIAERDVAITAKVLQLVNSAFFGVAGEIADLFSAIKCLGVNIVQELVLKVEAFREFQPTEEISAEYLEDLNEHSRLTAHIARDIAKARRVTGGVEAAAMLHDVGKLVILERTPAHFSRALLQSQDEGVSMHKVEQKLAGFSHAEVGAYLLSLWGLPNSIVEAVANHHDPKRLPRSSFDATAVVYTANCLANEVDSKLTRSGIERAPVLDVPYLAQLGVGNAIPQFRRIAEDAALALHGAAKR
ncbi:MAG TPA: HDOD domain-containing protein [Candidatus Acidoferrum sp.]|nr:HDOD domain-containing protein [Candidatus Acidoferrum sp.]